MFPLPLAVESWKKLEVQAVVLFIGKEDEFLSDHQAKETIKMVKDQGAFIHFYEPQKLPAVSLSQVKQKIAFTKIISTKKLTRVSILPCRKIYFLACYKILVPIYLKHVKNFEPSYKNWIS